MSAIPDPIVLPADRALGLKYAKGIWEDVAVPAVKKLKETYGDGISTLGLIYNATGFPITKVLNHNWEGSLFGSHPPQTIQNGEWGVFLHVHGSDSGKDSGSVGAVVYHGQNGSGVDYDWLLAWNNPNVVPDKLNTAYTEIREPGHYDDPSLWPYILQQFQTSSQADTNYEAHTLVKIDSEGHEYPYFVGILTLDGLL